METPNDPVTITRGELAAYQEARAEVEALRESNQNLREKLTNQTRATQEAATFWHDRVLERIEKHIPDGMNKHGHPIEQLVSMVVSVLDATNAKQRTALELCLPVLLDFPVDAADRELWLESRYARQVVEEALKQ